MLRYTKARNVPGFLVFLLKFKIISHINNDNTEKSLDFDEENDTTDNINKDIKSDYKSITNQINDNPKLETNNSFGFNDIWNFLWTFARYLYIGVHTSSRKIYFSL